MFVHEKRCVLSFIAKTTATGREVLAAREFKKEGRTSPSFNLSK